MAFAPLQGIKNKSNSVRKTLWKLDRLGRSLSHLVTIVEEFKKKRIAFKSLTEQMDTTTPHGEFFFNVFGSLAQYERALTKERIMAGLSAAKKRGKRGGRPRAISDEKIQAINEALNSGTSKAAVCRTFNVKRTTLYDALKNGNSSDNVSVIPTPELMSAFLPNGV